MDKPTKTQIREFWKPYGFRLISRGKLLQSGIRSVDVWQYPDGTTGFTPGIDLNNLFRWAVPTAIGLLESRFDALTNKIRALELLFQKWLDKIREGYSDEDALFWALYPYIKGG